MNWLSDPAFVIRVNSWLKSNLSFGGLQTGVALTIAQPFHKNVFARAVEIALLECRLGFFIFRWVSRLAFFQEDNQSTIDPRNKITHLAGLELSRYILDHHHV